MAAAYAFGVATDMLKNPGVNSMDQQVRPQSPVSLGKHVELIPRVARQSCSSARQLFEDKFTVCTAQSAIEVWRMHVPVG